MAWRMGLRAAGSLAQERRAGWEVGEDSASERRRGRREATAREASGGREAGEGPRLATSARQAMEQGRRQWRACGRLEKRETCLA